MLASSNGWYEYYRHAFLVANFDRVRSRTSLWLSAQFARSISVRRMTDKGWKTGSILERVAAGEDAAARIFLFKDYTFHYFSVRTPNNATWGHCRKLLFVIEDIQKLTVQQLFIVVTDIVLKMLSL